MKKLISIFIVATLLLAISCKKNGVKYPKPKKSDVVDIDKLLRGINTDYMKRKIRVYCPKSFIPNKIKINGVKRNRNLFINTEGYRFMEDLETGATKF